MVTHEKEMSSSFVNFGDQVVGGFMQAYIGHDL